jgi:hypothetical protein
LNNQIVNEAIKKAATQVASKHHYNFISIHKPKNLQDTGCMLTWIGYFLDTTEDNGEGYATKVASILFPLLEPQSAHVYFYNQLDKIDSRDWSDDKKLAAKVLRRFADVAFPVENTNA